MSFSSVQSEPLGLLGKEELYEIFSDARFQQFAERWLERPLSNVAEPAEERAAERVLPTSLQHLPRLIPALAVVRPTKGQKLVWTSCLHERFLQALRVLGSNSLYPMNVLHVMNVRGLTRLNVSSHLQKHKLKLRAGARSKRCCDFPPESNQIVVVVE